MSIITKDIICKQETLTLTNQRALVWEGEKTLVVSDLHIGKTAHFRKAGIAIPTTILHNDLKRLQQLIDHFDIRTIVIVGDLFHAGKNKDIDVFALWMEGHPHIQFELIKGNHDRLSLKFYESLRIKVYPKFKEIFPFRFVHDATHCNDETFCISGHTHPGVVINGRARQRIKLPCFEVNDNQLVLPAFSEFTGLNTKSSAENALCYAFTYTSLFKV